LIATTWYFIDLPKASLTYVCMHYIFTQVHKYGGSSLAMNWLFHSLQFWWCHNASSTLIQILPQQVNWLTDDVWAIARSVSTFFLVYLLFQTPFVLYTDKPFRLMLSANNWSVDTFFYKNCASYKLLLKGSKDGNM